MCLPIAARGQTILSLDDIDLSGLPQPTQAKALRYWFDDETDAPHVSEQLSGTYALDVSGLTVGLHTLHYQVVDSDDKLAYIGGGLFLKALSGTTLSVTSMRYWFDDDAASVQTTSGTTGSYMLDVKDLAYGLHTLHYQLMGEGGVATYVGSALFFNSGSKGTEPLKVEKLIYWYDDDTTMHVADMGDGPQQIDATGLTAGLHTLHYQALCTGGVMTSATSAFFLLMGADSESTTAVALRYWFDDATTANEVEITEGVQLLDASALTDGLHTVHYQILDSKGMPGVPFSSFFLKMNIDTSASTAKQLRYWFDDDASTVMVTTVSGGTQLLDASALVDGLHTVHYFIVDSKGIPGVPFSSFFLKMNIDTSASTAKQLRYWFDDDAETVTVTTVAGGTQTLDVSALPTGLHTLNYQLIDSNGKVGVPATRVFLKNFDKVLADGHNRVTKYQYWLNMNSQAMQTVELDAAANPYTLIALLPMQKEPIQSAQFHFEVTDGVPAIYAKNMLHVRFYDAQNYFTDGQKPFVDYSVKQEVEPVGELQSTQTFERVTANDIRWYTMQAAPGDTAAFRVSQAATVQVFAPSGKEVFKVSESASVNWSGIHTWEDGTYYVAVHDVTGNRTSMTLDYMHMDKYDVVDWDVHTVGNGGCSTITFKGNGFRDLYAVDLVIALGDTIHSVDVGHESDAETSVTFDFTGAELGKYDAIFHFTQEDKLFTNVVTVEEAVDIELATTVSFPSTFLRGTSTTYTVKITNMGNMTAYYVPLELRLKVNSIKNISEIHFDGYITPTKLSDVLLSDSLEEETINIIREVENEVSDLSQFVIYSDTLSNVDYGLSQIILSIPPNSTKTLTVAIKSSSTVSLEASMTDEWFPLREYKTSANGRQRVLKASKRDWMCCQRERFECAADALASIAGVFMPPGAGCATSLTLTGLETAYDVWCSDGGSASERWNNYLKSQGQSLANRLIQSAISCVTAYFHLQKKKLMEDRQLAAQLGSSTEVSRINSEIEALRTMERSVIRNIYNGICTSILGADCVKAFTETKPNCPPCTSGCGGGGSSSPVPPADPNDIYGYLSESGSKYIADHVEKVNYTIEFENDTTFAEASAHTIVIKDTLDSRYFDLQSFLPTNIKLGSRETYLNEADVMKQNDITSFLKTIDMRPEINAIAQVEGEYSQQTGIAKWTFTSLDPMTMEPTDDLMQGILPVNYDGTSGVGEVMFEVGMKPNKGHGKEIKNHASIVFDYEEAILTPTWVNTVDAIRPVSHVSDVKMLNDSTATVSIEATDELSGPWRYNVYVQYGSGAWFLGAENVPIDTTASVKVYEGIDHGFYVVVTDSAGNVEQKEAAREFSFEVFAPQVDTNTKLQLAQGWNWISHNQQEVLSAEALKPKAQRIVSQTDELFKDSRFGWTGGLDELLPTELYKVQMAEADEVQLSGKLFNAAFRSMPLYEGWNWIGYPVANTMTPAEALQKTDAEEGDFIVGQDGMATFTNSQWTGTLIQMEPGLGYMYRSVSDKSLFLNATSQTSSRRANVERSIDNGQAVIPEDWTVDKRKYPNVMGLVAELVQDGEAMDANKWLVGAFCGEECRGLSQTVGGHLMINVYGMGGERISFMALNRECGEVMGVEESEPFRTDILGTIQQPYELHSGVVTGIAEMENGRWKIGDAAVYDLQGRRVEKSSMTSNGIYIVTDGNKIQKHVNHKRKK